MPTAIGTGNATVYTEASDQIHVSQTDSATVSQDDKKTAGVELAIQEALLGGTTSGDTSITSKLEELAEKYAQK